MRKIGFCHGATFKVLNPFSKENIDLFINCGCSAIEVNCHSIGEADKLDSIETLINDFEYKSIHLPCDLKYKDDEITNGLLVKIEGYYNKIGAKLAVVHPDLIEDISVFDKYPAINWAVENMDDRKAKYKNVEDMREFFEINKQWGFVLDVGHCNANDKTMKLADDLIAGLKHKIREIHLSGYIVFHDPLYRTKQVEVIKRCKELDVPIIIESTFEKTDGIEGVAKEFDYILENLG